MTKLHLITGASGPLGLELARTLLESGNQCIFVVRDANKFKSLISYNPRLYDVWETNLEDEKQIEGVCAKIESHNTNLWSFIHLAAVSPQDRFDARLMQKVFLVNVFSAWQLASACIAKMAHTGGGRIVFAGSIGHKFGGKSDRAGYSSSKFTLEYFPRQFRNCAADNVLVNTLRIGVMKGGTQNSSGVGEIEFQNRVKLIPTGKEITNSEAVRNILFLCSQNNKSIHNSVINCSGGE